MQEKAPIELRLNATRRKGRKMVAPEKSMTTQEFANASGIPAAAISRLIRQGKLKASKKFGKWMIPQNQMNSAAVRDFIAAQKPAAGKSAAASTPAPGPQAAGGAAAAQALIPPPDGPEPETPRQKETPVEKGFSIAEFSAMTYLTEKGVADWLKSGRIKGRQLDNSVWQISADNLKVPDISRLLRK
jgi:hypothetical protein